MEFCVTLNFNAHSCLTLCISRQGSNITQSWRKQEKFSIFCLFDFMEFLLLDLIFIFIKKMSLYTFPLHKNSGISPALFPKRPKKEIKDSFHKCMIFSSFMYIDHFLSGVTTFFLLYCIFLTSAYNLVFLGGCKNY